MSYNAWNLTMFSIGVVVKNMNFPKYVTAENSSFALW